MRRLSRRLRCRAVRRDGNVGTVEVDLSSLERVPSERDEGVGGKVVGELDLLANGVTSSSGSFARTVGSIVDTLAFSTFKGLACEPVVAVAGLSWLTIGTVATLLS